MIFSSLKRQYSRFQKRGDMRKTLASKFGTVSIYGKLRPVYTPFVLHGISASLTPTAPNLFEQFKKIFCWNPKYSSRQNQCIWWARQSRFLTIYRNILKVVKFFFCNWLRWEDSQIMKRWRATHFSSFQTNSKLGSHLKLHYSVNFPHALPNGPQLLHNPSNRRFCTSIMQLNNVTIQSSEVNKLYSSNSIK